MIKVEEIDWSLYAIIDREWLRGRDIEKVAEEIIIGGAGVIQYRDKVSESKTFYREALKLRRITGMHNIPLIINDRVDIALAVCADGVHLGKEDLPVDVARKIVGDKMIIGASLKYESDFTAAKGADYFGVGAIYPTKTYKTYHVSGLDIIKKIKAKTHRPIIGIGGITSENVIPVFRAGADGIAVISAILGKNNVKEAAKNLLDVIRRAKLGGIDE